MSQKTRYEGNLDLYRERFRSPPVTQAEFTVAQRENARRRTRGIVHHVVLWSFVAIVLASCSFDVWFTVR